MLKGKLIFRLQFEFSFDVQCVPRFSFYYISIDFKIQHFELLKSCIENKLYRQFKVEYGNPTNIHYQLFFAIFTDGFSQVNTPLDSIQR